MLGGLFIMATAAIADALVHRSLASVRNVLFVVSASTVCVVLSGLPEVLWPDIPQGLIRVLKASTGPLAGAIALRYLGIWLGGMREDPIVHRITAWGSVALLACAVALALSTLRATPGEFRQLLIVAALVNLVSVVLATVAAVRAAILGDPLARWMVLACACLAVMVYGIYARALSLPAAGLGTWILTAACVIGYFLIVTMLVITRTRTNRRLKRLAGLQLGADAATGLPTGSALLSEIGDAFARCARGARQCTVVCLYLRNLYQLGDSAGHGVENQIQAAMAARIRRAAGFRSVVGLYHPRCFVVVIPTDMPHQLVNARVVRLRALIAHPLSVVGRHDEHHDFIPRLGIGVVTVDPVNADPLEVLNDAERQALGPGSPGPREAQDEIASEL